MQLIELILNHYNFYCPVTGELISKNGEPVNFDASSLRGYWVSEEMESPVLYSDEFSSTYKKFLIKCIKNNNEDNEDNEDNYVPGWEELEVFLKEYKEPSWVVFNITTRLSDQHMTNAWYVIDMTQ
jgi:hypothetical protein